MIGIRRSLVTLLSCAVLIGGAGMMQIRLTHLKPQSWFTERMTFVPDTDRFKKFLFGFETIYADYLWIRTTLYLGGHYVSDHQFPWLVRMVDMVTKINPRFYPAYEFAGLMLPDLGNDPAAAKVILERGLSHVTSRQWKLAFYLGSIHLESRQFDRAADYFARAAQMPGAPKGKLATLAGAMYAKAGEKERALAFLAFMYETSEDPLVKARIKERIAGVMGGGS